jgi:hypothetical protein
MKHNPQSIHRAPIFLERVRRIEGGFCFIPHRFLQGGFFASLSPAELLLYFLLVLASDRNGVSFYGCDAICSLMAVELDVYIAARNGLIEKDLIAFDGTRFQVLSLPERPVVQAATPLSTSDDFERADPATIRTLIRESLGRHATKDV